MIDINLIRENKDLVKENIKKKFQDQKLPLVDEVYEYDKLYRECKNKCDTLKNKKNKLSDTIGVLVKEKKQEEINKTKIEISSIQSDIDELDKREIELQNKIKERMMVIPNIIDESVPVGKDDSENIEIEKYGEPVVPKYEIPYHADILEPINGLDKE